MEQFASPRDEPIVSIEARSPQAGQRLSAQMYLAEYLSKAGVVPIFHSTESDAFTETGAIRKFSIYDISNDRAVNFVFADGIVPDAWRLRDATWQSNDKSAFRPGRGYNSTEFREELDNRLDLEFFLEVCGLGKLSLCSAIPDMMPEGAELFIKPNYIDDITQEQPGMPRRRAHLVGRASVGVALSFFDEDVIVQARQETMPVEVLIRQLGVSPHPTGMLDQNALHAVRLYQPLWQEEPVLAEVRLSNPWEIGSNAPSQQHLLEPQKVLESFPALADAHLAVSSEMSHMFGKPNFPAMDYLLTPDADPRVVAIHRRAYTPDLGQRTRVTTELARRVVDAEVKKLVELAYS